MHNNNNNNNNNNDNNINLEKDKNEKNDLITTFKLPIAFINKDKLHEVDAHVMTDLELIKTVPEPEKILSSEHVTEKTKQMLKITWLTH